MGQKKLNEKKQEKSLNNKNGLCTSRDRSRNSDFRYFAITYFTDFSSSGVTSTERLNIDTTAGRIRDVISLQSSILYHPTGAPGKGVFFAPNFKEDISMPKNKYKQRPDGRYEAKVQVGYKPDGRPDRITVYADTSAELEKKVRNMKYEIEHGTYISRKETTMADYSRKWYRTYKAVKGLNTRKMYENIIDKHIVPDVGYLKVYEVQKSDIQGMINDRADHRRTCEQIVMTVKQILDSAVEDQLILSNPCAKIQLPEQQKSQKRALTEAEKEALKKADFTDQERAYVMIAYGCGLRREEIIALSRADINLRTRLIDINNVVVFDGNNPQLENRAKSKSGIRSVDIPTLLIPTLKNYLKTCGFQLFTKRDGQLMTKSSYDKMWASIVKKMNAAAGGDNNHQVIFGLTSHTFRHNYCTMLYYSGISIKKAVQLMGHADEKMIMRIYAHLDEEKERTKEKIDMGIAL